MSGNVARSGIASVHRALDVLEAVARRGVVGVSELADQLDMPVSTIHSILGTLAQRHFVARTRSGYRLGSAAAGLAVSWDVVQALGDTLDATMAELTAATHLAATATVLTGREARVIASTSAPGPITVRTQATWRRPLTLATGRVLIAHGPRPAWASFLKADPESARQWPAARWRAEFETIRRTAVAIKFTRDPRDAVSIAAPVYDAAGAAVCAIGCSSPAFLARDLFNVDVAAHLHAAASALSTTLGGPIPPPIPTELVQFPDEHALTSRYERTPD